MGLSAPTELALSTTSARHHPWTVGELVMNASEDGPTTWLPIAEAAPRMGLTVDGLRSRIRRGLVRPRKGNDGRLLVAISTTGEVTGHEPVTDIVSDRSEADELRSEVLELRVTLARVEERLAAGTRREGDLQGLVTDLRAERDRLSAEFAEARKGWLERLLEAVRRK
jgi:hypothetical protein